MAKKSKIPSISFQPIGEIRTPFTDRFGIPRQPGLSSQAEGIIELYPDSRWIQACQQLDGFSHLWIVFVFHSRGSKTWKPSIRPPRLGGRKKIGVLASRSPHRPNPIGLSAVELVRVEGLDTYSPKIYVKGVDLLDGTPILDIKPYLDYCDRIENSRSGWASEPIHKFPVEFSEAAKNYLAENFDEEKYRDYLLSVISDVLSLDPRTAAQKHREMNGPFGIKILDLEVRWLVRPREDFPSILVTEILPKDAPLLRGASSVKSNS